MTDYPKYYVLNHNMNKDCIEPFDIFNHYRITQFLEEQRKKHPTYEEFDIQFKRLLQYCYWCKSEYEVVVSAWCGGYAKEKIDIYTQIMLNYGMVVDLAWKEVIKRWRKRTS